MDKIKEQTNRVIQLVFAGDTAQIYQRTLTRSWDILRETGILIWLVICLVFVGGEWFYRNSIQLGSQTRAWYQQVSENSGVSGTDPSQSVGSTGQALLHSLQSGALYLLDQARQQLGITKPEAAAPSPIPPDSKPEPPSSPSPATAEEKAAPVPSTDD
ncbi:MAG: hypothetical protein LVS60_03805 [Nodosilinea sp. LVE1205-7]|jgi:hypothetical protein